MSQPPPHEHYEALLMRAVDGVLSAAQRAELDAHLHHCEQCRSELSDFTDIKEITDAMTDRIARHASIEPPRPRAAARVWLSLSNLALLAGATLLIGFAGYTLWSDPEVPSAVKAGAALMAAGGVALLLYVLRVRLRARGRDPYLDIDE